MSISNEKGDIGEAAFALAAAKKGYWIGKMPQGCPYDFILDRKDGKLLRVQVKFRTIEKTGIISIKIAQNTFTNRTTYSADNIDYIAVYVNDFDKVYLIPIDKITDVTEAKLRCVESEKRKDKNSRLISQFEEW